MRVKRTKPLTRNPTRGTSFGIPAVAVVTLAAFACGCEKKKEEAQAIPNPPAHGTASSDELTTGLGQARGLDEALASSSVKWVRTIVLDDKRVGIIGEGVSETVFLRTDDAGKTWHSFRSERGTWSNWSTTLDGNVAVAFGSRDGAAAAFAGPVESTRLAFATWDAPSLTTTTPLFPTAKGPAKGLVPAQATVPAVFSTTLAALVAEDSPKHPALFFGGKPGSDAVAPVPLPSGEKVCPVPYGRPPMLLSIKGQDVFSRPFAPSNGRLELPQKVQSLRVTPTLLADLSTPPACEWGEWSYQRVAQPPKRVGLLAVAAGKLEAFALPEGTAPATKIGCGPGRVVVEAVQPKTGPPALWAEQPDLPTIVTCKLGGKCTTPKNAPFRVWPEPHQQEITTTATEQGTLGILGQRAGDRWSLLLAQSEDGTVFERPRLIGEGVGERGRIELGALMSLGKRALLLVSADVTGTSRRGWFVLVSDDGGTNWGPP